MRKLWLVVLMLAGISYGKTADITNFGAIADYLTDNTVAIQGAVDSLMGIGGIVFVPSSSLCYGVLNSVVLGSDAYSNIKIEGDGRGSCIKSLRAIGTNGSNGMIRFSGTSAYSITNVGISNLRVSGLDEVTSDGPLVSFANSSDTFVRDSFADISRNEAFYWNSSSDSRRALVTGNYVTRTGGYGSTSISDYRAAYNANVLDLILTSNRSYQVGLAVEQTGTTALISNNIFDTCGLNLGASATPCVSLQSTYSVGFSKVKITNNVIKRCSTAVTFATNAGENQIINNLIEFCNAGVHSASVVQPDVVLGNYLFDTISDSQGSAILFSGSAGGVAENNTIVAGAVPWAYGIRVTDNTGVVVVRHNTIIGPAVTSVFFDGGDSTHTNVQFLNNKIAIGSSLMVTTRYRFLNASFSVTDFSGIDSDQTSLSTVQPKLIIGTVPTKGTWLVGDRVIGIGNVQYVNVVAGSPGIWSTY